jgi:hypothetical protein
VSPTARRRRHEAPDPFPEHGLAELGLAAGDAVRFRRRDTERWKAATVARRERDGSVGLHDAKGAARAIPIECIEVRDTGPRGGVVWEPLPERAARTEQLALVRSGKPAPDDPRSTDARARAAAATAQPGSSAAGGRRGPAAAATTPGSGSAGAAGGDEVADDGGDDGQLSLL